MKYNADDYAKWIVDNKSQKGTDRFNTVAKAYEEAKQTELEDKNRTFPSAIVKGAETFVPNVISGVSDFYNAAKKNPVEVAKSTGVGLANLLQNVALLPINSIANTPNPIPQSIYDAYGSAEKIKRSIEKSPATTLSDFALALSGTGGLIRAGAAKIPNSIARGIVDTTGNVMEKTARAVDPTTLVARVVTKPLRLAAETNVGVITPGELKTKANVAYKEVKDADIVFKQSSINDFLNTVKNDLDIDKTLHPNTTAALKRLQELKGKNNVEFNSLEQARRIFNEAMVASSKTNKADAMLATRLRNKIDNFVENTTDADFVAGDVAQVPKIKEARNYWSRLRKGELIDELIKDAELNVDSKAYGNMDSSLRNKFLTIAKDEDLMRTFSEKQRQAILNVVQGGPTRNTLRQVGKLNPSSVFSQGTLATGVGAGAGFALGGPPLAAAALAIPVIGKTAQMGANVLTKRAATRAAEAMRMGSDTASVGGRLASLLDNFGDKLASKNKGSAFAVDYARKTLEAGRSIDPFYAAQLARLLAQYAPPAQDQEQ